VIHLAAEGNPMPGFMTGILKPNIIGMYNICEEAKRSKVKRFIFASTNHT
jgi:nucleoside-diphosphate-sugar epimerase